MTAEEFLEKLINPNKEVVLKGMEHFVNEYSSMVTYITYVSFDRGVHNIMLVTKDSLTDMLRDEFLIQMNMVLPNAEVGYVTSLSDPDTQHSTHIVQVIESGYG